MLWSRRSWASGIGGSTMAAVQGTAAISDLWFTRPVARFRSGGGASGQLVATGVHHLNSRGRVAVELRHGATRAEAAVVILGVGEPEADGVELGALLGL